MSVGVVESGEGSSLSRHDPAFHGRLADRLADRAGASADARAARRRAGTRRTAIAAEGSLFELGDGLFPPERIAKSESSSV